MLLERTERGSGRGGGGLGAIAGLGGRSSAAAGEPGLRRDVAVDRGVGANALEESVARDRVDVCLATAGLDRLGVVVEDEILREDEFRDVMRFDGGVVGLLERAADDGVVEEQAVRAFFPSTVLFKDLVAHVTRDLIGKGNVLRAGLETSWTALDDFRARHNGRVGASVELEGGDGDEREGNVGAVGPRERLGLDDLHRQVHAGGRTALPVKTRSEVFAVAIEDGCADLAQIDVGELRRQIGRLADLCGKLDRGFEVQHVACSMWRADEHARVPPWALAAPVV